MSTHHSSRIELSQSALKSNLAFIRGIIGPRPEISMVVKANAYGHGLAQVVPMAEKCGIRHFAVASSFEAEGVLEVKSPGSRVMIMGILYDEDLPWAVENEIDFFVFDGARLLRAAEVAKAAGLPARVHLELETGGNRTGITLEELLDALRQLKSNRKHLHFAGLCTHLAGAESFANQFRISRQLDRFEAMRKRLSRSRIAPEALHIASSAAAIAMPEVALDMVRVGTAAYGIWPSPDIHNIHLKRHPRDNNGGLHRVLTWKTDVMHVKSVQRNEFVGYGTSYQAYRDMTVAVVPVGYANGYPREMSNRGYALIHGRKAPVVGAVNMNMFMVDVTSIPGVEVGDEVVLIGKQKRNIITLRSFSEFSSALNNEFVSRLPAAIPRQIVR